MIADITAALEQVREWRERGATIPIPEDNKATDAYVIAVVARDRYERLFRNIGLKLVGALVDIRSLSDGPVDKLTLRRMTHFDPAYNRANEALTEFAEEVERLK